MSYPGTDQLEVATLSPSSLSRFATQPTFFIAHHHMNNIGPYTSNLRRRTSHHRTTITPQHNPHQPHNTIVQAMKYHRYIGPSLHPHEPPHMLQVHSMQAHIYKLPNTNKICKLQSTSSKHMLQTTTHIDQISIVRHLLGHVSTNYDLLWRSRSILSHANSIVDPTRLIVFTQTRTWLPIHHANTMLTMILSSNFSLQLQQTTIILQQ